MKIQTKNLTKKYGDKLAVAGIDIEIEPGKILGLLGPNGAGKSTTIKMLSGQIAPSEGTIKIDGKEFSHIPEKLRGKIGVMPQEVIIWDDLTLKENLYFTATMQNIPGDKAQKRIEYLIDSLNLQNELNTVAKNLSGGYKRRLNLAISIVHEPTLIFLDEPTPGIDAQNRRFLWDFIASLRENKYSVVLTDHYLEEAERLSDYVVIIDYGKILAEGTVSQLKKKYGEGKLLKVDFSEDGMQSEDLTKAIDEIKTKFSSAKLLKSELSILAPDLFVALKEVIQILEKYKIATEDISIKETSLEDIFLLLTGRSIRE